MARRVDYVLDWLSMLYLDTIIIIGATARSNAYFGQGSGLIHMSSVSCTGVETALLDCSYLSPGSLCDHYDDAGVTCWQAVQYSEF
jgi:hypothetical protein